MDNLMKLVLAALEWSYEAKATDVQEEWLELAAELLVLRHDTFRIIDGEGPGRETEKQASGAERKEASEMPAKQIASPNEEQKPPLLPTEQETQARSREKEEQPAALGNCTFSGIVPIALQRFKAHPRRKTNTPATSRRWVRGKDETDWDVVGGSTLPMRQMRRKASRAEV
jgi:hypothetical protein